MTWKPCTGLYVLHYPARSQGPCKRPKIMHSLLSKRALYQRLFALSQQIMLSRAKTCPRTWPTRRKLRDTSANSSRCMRSPHSVLGSFTNQRISSPRPMRSTLCSLPMKIPPRLKTTNTIVIRRLKAPNHSWRTYPRQMPKLLRNCLCYALVLKRPPPPA